MELLKIETDRLILRDFAEEDWEQIHEYCEDPAVTRYLTWGPNTEQQTKDFISLAIESQGQEPRKTFELAVILKETGKIVGAFGIRIRSVRRREADLGCCFKSNVWERGVATESARALVKFGFEQLELHRIYAMCVTENKGAARMLLKVGFTKEGHLRENERIKGKWHDSLIFGILVHEWELNRHKYEDVILTV